MFDQIVKDNHEMKVLWLVNGYPTEKNPEYCVFTKEQIDALKLNGVVGDVYFINAREHGYSQYWMAFRFLRRMRNEYKIIHCFHGLTYILVRLSFISDVRVIVSLLNSIDNEYKELNNVYVKLLVLVTKYFLKTSEDHLIVKDDIPKWIDGKSRVHLLPNGVDTTVFRPIDRNEALNVLGLSDSKKYILFVSSKNLNRSQKRKDIFDAVIQELINRHSLIDIQPLYLSQSERWMMPYYYSASSVHLLTSDFEGSPNSVKEAIACGTPVVSRLVGNVATMLSDVKGCYVLNTSNPSDLADAVVEVIKSGVRIDSKTVLDRRLDMESKTRELVNIYSRM